jgi:cyclic pyranopterin phosphate synthase
MLKDSLSRTITDLRISVTDRCNFRCTYCMPLDEYAWTDKNEILTFEEITRLVQLFVTLGVNKVRLTGGEPLVRTNLPKLIEKLSRIKGLDDLCLTTNGSLLEHQAKSLAAAGLQRVNVSLDTLDREKFRRLTKRGNLSEVLAGIFEANHQGLEPIKLNAVVMRGENENDVVPLAEFGRKYGFEMRFIEYMDVGNVNHWSRSKTVPKTEILELIRTRFPLESVRTISGPSVNYRYLDGLGKVGVIASITEPFCGDCTRARITADGKLVTCLFSSRGHDLKKLLRNGASDLEIVERVRSIWRRRTDQYSENRLAAGQSNSLSRTIRSPKLEMINLGG